MTATDRLVAQVQGMDQDDFAERVVDVYLPKVLAEVPWAVGDGPDARRALQLLVLGGITELLQSLALGVEVEGPEGDPTLEVLALTVGQVQLALRLLDPFLPAMTLRGGPEAEALGLLAGIVNGFRAAYGDGT